MQRFTLGDINADGEEAFVEALGHLFEHSPWVARKGYASRPFATLGALHEALCGAMRSATRDEQLALVRAHPDLAGRLALSGGLTASSAGEQASAGLDQLTPSEAAEIERLNSAYLGKFGFPFVICARLNDKSAILAAMRARALNSPDAELSTALGEIAKIAWLRLKDAVADTH
ncbi:MAG TPA: 2-oxo-4-hydroxy-4-carboxy-5-ureidoimidazoline decarboxylase [Opitutaceae bacterium]|jgi:2-oxo-4-hydroxy-4-carboxy-5-ureidoimidazoline decarboxylase